MRLPVPVCSSVGYRTIAVQLCLLSCASWRCLVISVVLVLFVELSVLCPLRLSCCEARCFEAGDLARGYCAEIIPSKSMVAGRRSWQSASTRRPVGQRS
mmetsp:Transcript_9084/g.21735  ORF Transcript_9084/g.21735 Transcript_9084/m.21735 type:complete len:99 (-) Transcript_9084:617-913(-)